MSKMLSATALIMMNVKYRMIKSKAVEKELRPERIGAATNAWSDADGSRHSVDRIAFGQVNAPLGVGTGLNGELICREKSI